ncbi:MULTISPECIES: hypothetical protein [Pseudomonas]|uniref:hypothetical protein n=1 Tax=Pseudomonas TaxID=286 RepID=UPI000EFE7E9B|nr:MULTISPECIES: hypothetical protein [Pseudomonas]MCJ2375148.1 hypothetical protein [Pseudomonas sp. RGM 3321]
MNLYDVRLTQVRLADITATAVSENDEVEDKKGYNANLHVEIVHPGDGLAVGDFFEVKIALLTTESKKPFLQMTMFGTFEILGEAALTDLGHENAPYELGSLLYPYIRNLTKPIIEYMGASAVELPFAPPAPPAKKKKAVRRKKPVTE